MDIILNKLGCVPKNVTCLEILRKIAVQIADSSDSEAWALLKVYIEQQLENHESDSQQHQPVHDTSYYVTLWTIAVPIVFAFIIVIGIIGNILVIYVVLTTVKLRTSTHMFLLNLALSDITVLAICVPFQAYKYAAWGWFLGNTWCKIIQYLLYVTIYVTIWTLVCIAGIRYVVLVHNTSRFHRYIIKDRPVQICAALWLAMLLLHIPTMLSHRVNIVADYTYCGVQPDLTKFMFISFFSCAYILPLCLICIFYLLVIHHLHMNRTSCVCRSNYTFRVSKVVISVVMVFSACWLPYHINSLISLFGSVPKGKAYEMFRVIGHCLLYGNSLANPFIYNFVSSDFRAAFKSILLCNIGRKRNTNYQLCTQNMSVKLKKDGSIKAQIDRNVRIKAEVNPTQKTEINTDSSQKTEVLRDACNENNAKNI